MKTLKEALAVERSVEEMLSEIKARMFKEIGEAQVPGVKKVANNAVVVSTAHLCDDIWLPSYYIQEIQADLVEQKLSSAKTATEFLSRIQSMILNKRVTINGETDRLNSKTLSILESFMEGVTNA